MNMVHADELRPGDIVDYRGQRHIVSRILRLAGSAWPVASDDSGWAIALGRQLLPVDRAA